MGVAPEAEATRWFGASPGPRAPRPTGGGPPRASSRCATAVDVPNVHVVCARPWLFVLAEAGAADPPPVVTRNSTSKFFAGFPRASVAWITTGCGRAVPTVPCCPSPDTTENERLDPAGAVVSRLHVTRSKAARLSAADAGNRTRRIQTPALGGQHDLLATHQKQ